MNRNDARQGITPSRRRASRPVVRRALAPRPVDLASAAFAVAGLCFVLYPAIRLFSDENSMQGARAYASASWIVAHSLGIAAFILLALGVFGVSSRLLASLVAGRAVVATTLSWVGSA